MSVFRLLSLPSKQSASPVQVQLPAKEGGLDEVIRTKSTARQSQPLPLFPVYSPQFTLQKGHVKGNVVAYERDFFLRADPGYELLQCL